MEADITLFGTPNTWSVEADRSLLEAARRMNKEAIMSIFDRYSRPLYNYALLIGPGDLTYTQEILPGAEPWITAPYSDPPK